jgi:hypothetical protein
MAYQDVKEFNNPICQSSEDLLEALNRGAINNGDYISLIEIMILMYSFD